MEPINHHPSWREYYPFLWLFYFNVFCSCATYALVLPAIWSYLEKSNHQDTLVALILLSFSLGEVFGAVSFGVLRDFTSTRYALLFSLSLGLLGSILATFASVAGESYKMLLLCIGRVLQGIWNGGEQAVEQSYISEVVSDVTKLRALSEIGIAGICGYVLGPAIGVAITYVDMDLHENFLIDEYWSAGVFQAGVVVLMLCINFVKFKEIPVEMRVNRSANYESYEHPNRFGVFTCLVLSFVLFYGFTVQQTITGPLVTDSLQKYTSSFDYSPTTSYLLVGLEGAVSILGLGLMAWLNEKIDDRVLLVFSTILGVVGWVFFIDFTYKMLSHTAFYIGFTLISLQFAMARNAAFTIYSKIIGPYPAGLYMGLMLGAGCLSRTLTPYFAMNFIESSIKICGITCSSSLLVATVLVVIFWKQCAPHQQNVNSNLIIIDFTFATEDSVETPLLRQNSDR